MHQTQTNVQGRQHVNHLAQSYESADPVPKRPQSPSNYATATNTMKLLIRLHAVLLLLCPILAHGQQTDLSPIPSGRLKLGRC